MFGRVIRQAWWDFYDGLWRLIAANMVLGTVAILVLFLTHDVAEAALSTPGTAIVLWGTYCLLIGPLFGAAWIASLCGFARRNSQAGEAGFRDMLEGLRRSFGPLWRCLLASGGLLMLLGANLWFYLAPGIIPREFALAAYVLAFLTGWLVLGAVGATMHGVMLVVARGVPPLRALRLGLALTLAFPGATIGVIGVTAVMWMASASCQFAGFLLGAFAATAVLVNSLHDAVDDWEQSLSPGDPAAREERREAYERRYDRGWRDMLRPWEV